MTFLYFDIETATGTLDAEALAYAERRTGETWTLDRLAALAPLSPVHGRVVAIGWAVDDRPVRDAVSLDDERGLLTEFARVLASVKEQRGDFRLVGHNAAGFDVPYLQRRALALGVPGLVGPLGGLGGKPWESPVMDTQRLLPGTTVVPGDQSLVIACRSLGIEQDGEDVKGHGISELVTAGDVEGVRRHVRADVERVRALHRRLVDAV